MTAWLIAALALAQTPSNVESGATLRIYDVRQPMSKLYPLAPNQTPNVDKKIDRIDLADNQFTGSAADGNKVFTTLFIAEVFGFLQIEQAGEYTFRLTSDDGSTLSINGQKIIDNDGVHAPKPVEQTVRLRPGLIPFHVWFFENNGGEVLKLEWKRPGAADFEVLDSRFLRTEAGVTRVVAPGIKLIVTEYGILRPGKLLPLDKVHPAWEVHDIMPPGFEARVGGLAFLPDGRLLVTTFVPNQSTIFNPGVRDGKVWILEGVLGRPDPQFIKVKLFATGLKDPLGVCVVDGRIFVSEQFQITELIDTDGDDRADEHKVVANGWKSDNYHHFTFGLKWVDGWLYGALSTNIDMNAPGINGPNPPHRGSVFRVQPDRYDPNNPQANIEFLTGGSRTPNGLTVGPEGEIFVADNQGSWLPANKLNWVRKGVFFGHRNSTDVIRPEYPNGGVPALYQDQEPVHPTLYLPQNEVANSPSEGVLIPDGPFKGQILLADVTYSGLRRCYLEKVGGQWQGSVMRSSQGLRSGGNRLIWGPDGALYYGGIGAGGNWGWADPETGKIVQFGLQKLIPTGGTTFEIAYMKLADGGFEIGFTEPVDKAWLGNARNYAVEQWHYEPTVEYGGEKIGLETLKLMRAVPGADGKSVRLVMAGLKEGSVVYVQTDPKSVDGKPIWSTDIWYTYNKKQQ